MLQHNISVRETQASFVLTLPLLAGLTTAGWDCTPAIEPRVEV